MCQIKECTGGPTRAVRARIVKQPRVLMLECVAAGVLQLLLGYLPSDPSAWDEVLARKRTEYLLFCEVRTWQICTEGRAGRNALTDGKEGKRMEGNSVFLCM